MLSEIKPKDITYASFTFADQNPVVRWLQYQRLKVGLKLCVRLCKSPKVICDFGAGNGELCKVLAEKYPTASLICYEPESSMLDEARQNLNGVANVQFSQDIVDCPLETADVVFCLQVFEHLPAEATSDALSKISALLKPGGIIIVGIPNEVGIPAAYKGLFRMTRKFGAFDASLKNVVLALIGRPPVERPVREIAPGLLYYPHHMGFDFRRFKKNLSSYFSFIKGSSSPFAFLGSWLMPEIYYVAEKPRHSVSRSAGEV